MAREIHWSRRLGVRLGAIALVLAAGSVLITLVNLATVDAIRGDAAAIHHSSKGRWRGYQMLVLALQLVEESGPRKDEILKELRQAMDVSERRFEQLLRGDLQAGIPAVAYPEVRRDTEERKQLWDTQIKPRLERVIALATDANAKHGRDTPQVRTAMSELDQVIQAYVRDVAAGVDQHFELQMKQLQWFQTNQLVFVGATLFFLGLVFWNSRSIARRTRQLARTADQIAAGDLTRSARVSGHDELAALGESFDVMTANLRRAMESEQQRRARLEKLLTSVRETVARLTAIGAEILASTTQQAAGAQQQAAAVTQTVATVDEVTQTSDQSARRAKAAGEAVERTLEIGKAGRKTVEDSTVALETVRERVEATAESILALAEQAQAIGEIIATVNDIAEQTHLLALNAAIEASRAGEHGRGFAVVAGEVKGLADQSKKATAQVRQILGEIQKATNTAVLSTEEVTKGVTAANRVSAQASDTIKALADTLAEVSQATAQIVASAGQQAVGMAQIHEAMKNIDQVARQNLEAMRQAELAAQHLNTLGSQLTELVNA